MLYVGNSNGRKKRDEEQERHKSSQGDERCYYSVGNSNGKPKKPRKQQSQPPTPQEGS